MPVIGVLLAMECRWKHEKIENCGDERMASMGSVDWLVVFTSESNDGQGSGSLDAVCNPYTAIFTAAPWDKLVVHSPSPTDKANGRKEGI